MGTYGVDDPKPLKTCPHAHCKTPYPAEILAAKQGEKAYKLFDGDGLYLKVMTSGSKSWRMKYRMDGRENRITFGQFPDISLKDARKNGMRPGILWPLELTP